MQMLQPELRDGKDECLPLMLVQVSPQQKG